MASVFLGINKSNPKEQVIWDTSSVVNGHWIIVGGTGAGKTYQIGNICRQMQKQGMRIHIFDPHGDIETDPRYTSYTEFSEISPYGINPLIINPSPMYGGVRKRINAFIQTVNKYSSKLDDRQEAGLRYMLTELYARHGFDYANPDTWASGELDASAFKKMPTIDDLHDLIYHKLRGFFLGHMSKVSDLFDRMNDRLLSYRRLQRYKGEDHRERARDNDALIEQERQKLNEMKEELKDTFNRCIETVQDDEIDQYIRYGSRDLLKSLYDKIENIRNLGIFKPTTPPFEKEKPLWRYDMSSLRVEEQGYLVELTLEQIFADAIQRGFVNEVDTLVFIDEAQRFLSVDDKDSTVSIIYREARKFGVGLALATQNCAAFPQDVVINAGTKVVLGVDEAYQDIMARVLGIERVRFIQPRKNALIQIKAKNTLSGNRFIDTLLGGKAARHED